MINLKKTVLAFLFLASSAFAQDGGLKGLLTDNASIGASVGMMSYVSSDSDMELAYGVTDVIVLKVLDPNTVAFALGPVITSV